MVKKLNDFYLRWCDSNVLWGVVDPEEGSALDRRPDRSLRGLAGVVGHVPGGHEVTAGPAIKVEFQDGLNVVEKVGGHVGGANVSPETKKSQKGFTII